MRGLKISSNIKIIIKNCVFEKKHCITQMEKQLKQKNHTQLKYTHHHSKTIMPHILVILG